MTQAAYGRIVKPYLSLKVVTNIVTYIVNFAGDNVDIAEAPA